MRLFGLLLVSFWLIGIKAVAAPPTCVVSLMPPAGADSWWTSNTEIRRQAENILYSMKYEEPGSLFRFEETLSGLRQCLEGEYEEVILVAHTAEVVQGHVSILYPHLSSNAGSNWNWRVLNARIFSRLQISQHLREITLMMCDAEAVLEEYPILNELAKRHQFAIRLPPTSLTGLLLTGQPRLRATALIAALIAEASQRPNANEIFCLLETGVIGAYEYGTTRCLRNHFQITLHAPLSFGLRTSLRFVRLTPAEGETDNWNLAIADFEAGFVRGIELSVTDSLLHSYWDIPQELFGISISLFKILLLERIGAS